MLIDRQLLLLLLQFTGEYLAGKRCGDDADIDAA